MVWLHPPINNNAQYVSRTQGVDIFSNIVYGMQTIELFKGDPNEEYAEGKTFDIAIPGQSCGAYVELEAEYLIGFQVDPYYEESIGGVVRFRAKDPCGLVRSWSTIYVDDMKLFCDGFDDWDPCEGGCGKFQVRAMRTEKRRVGGFA